MTLPNRKDRTIRTDRVKTAWKATYGEMKAPRAVKAAALNSERESRIRGIEMSEGREAAIVWADAHPIYE